MSTTQHTDKPEVPNTVVTLDGMRFKCPYCGSNMFHMHDRKSGEFHCNGCHAEYEGEKE